jgi:hypothetical protein
MSFTSILNCLALKNGQQLGFHTVCAQACKNEASEMLSWAKKRLSFDPDVFCSFHVRSRMVSRKKLPKKKGFAALASLSEPANEPANEPVNEPVNELVNPPEDAPVNERRRSMPALIRTNKQISDGVLDEKLQKGHSAIIQNIKWMKNRGILKRIGADKTGHWEIISR